MAPGICCMVTPKAPTFGSRYLFLRFSKEKLMVDTSLTLVPFDCLANLPIVGQLSLLSKAIHSHITSILAMSPIWETMQDAWSLCAYSIGSLPSFAPFCCELLFTCYGTSPTMEPETPPSTPRFESGCPTGQGSTVTKVRGSDTSQG